jgi:dephospho-CoA kinase
MARSPLRVALTGGIASGKSTCLATLRALGVPAVDADVLARDAVAPGSEGLAAVVDAFGADALAPDGTLNRPAMAARVFADADARATLEAIIHPRVQAAIDDWFDALDGPVGVADIPLLFETGRAAAFDIVIVAACSPEQQLARLMARDGLSEADARARLSAQWSLADKTARADYVIETGGTLGQTTENTRDVWMNLQSRI